MSENNLPRKWSRAVINWVRPEVDCGRWPIKRVPGETVNVSAGLIIDGHDKLAAELVFRHENGKESVAPMELRHNDEYHASFEVEELGRYSYYVRVWPDRFGTWLDQFRRRVDADETESLLKSELLDGANLIREVSASARGKALKELTAVATALESGDAEIALRDGLASAIREHDPRESAVTSRTFEVVVDPVLARFSAWYEFFPRSTGTKPLKHGTLDDAARILPRIKELGFDIVYLPPIHPIGKTHRKGKDNAPVAKKGEPGSPWAIGGELEDGRAGGFKSVHPELGGLEAFTRFVEKADSLGLKVALDIAFQTSPDHPYVKERPEWFRHRPDGSIRYAENPPKKYQDVYPFNFETDEWRALWQELKSVFEFWIQRGVRIFRVDNPHTKPFPFWEWCIAELRSAYPDVIFLSEAFARPKIMYTLAKLGFNQSYTYYTWRNTKEELQEYCRELFETEVVDFFRPNFWPNTPDILHDYLVHGGRPAHVVRFVLAATLSSAYGVYGPPYEHVDNRQHPEREEYANNEKYEIRTWNWNDPDSLQPLMKRVNQIRKENPALQYMRNLLFHETDNPHIIAYSKTHGENLILVVANLDPFHTQSGWIHLPLEELRLSERKPYQMHDLLDEEFYLWSGPANYVELNPHVRPVHVFHVRRYVRTERDFDYFL